MLPDWRNLTILCVKKNEEKAPLFDGSPNLLYNIFAVKTALHFNMESGNGLPIDHREYARDKLGDRTATCPETVKVLKLV